MYGIYEYKQFGKPGVITRFKLMSASPRRRSLLAFLKPETASITINERDIEAYYMAVYRDETFIERAAKTCCEIAVAKAGVEPEAGTLLISADTVVVMADHICNKPIDHADADRMFRAYFGRTHHVVTAVCLMSEGYLEAFYSIAEVRFVDYYPQLEAAISAYTASDSPMDKAGAYGIQALDPRFVAQIRGDLNTIIGMPVAETAARIARWRQ